MIEKEIDRQDLMKQLTDASIKWTHDELMGVITQELRKDSSICDIKQNSKVLSLETFTSVWFK